MTTYAIRHVTSFSYEYPVRFARCNLRLAPIDFDGQRVERHKLDIDPPADVRPGFTSGYPVNTTRAVVAKPATKLVIESEARVVVDRVVPGAEAGDPSIAEAAAAARAFADLSPLAPANYLYPSPLIAAFPEIADWCARELQPARGVVEAGLALARAIKAEFTYDGSATELDTSPAEAFAARHGVCQDFAQIMISGARSAGLATAYVSGYLRTLPPPGKPRLVGADATHAWVLIWCGEVRGWIGFDPTNGVTMGPDHIVAAIGRDYADVSPIDGIFLGRNGQEIKVSVDVEPLD
jgi:transglutaminase-like putative cysteine protease